VQYGVTAQDLRHRALIGSVPLEVAFALRAEDLHHLQATGAVPITLLFKVVPESARHVHTVDAVVGTGPRLYLVADIETDAQMSADLNVKPD